jgi:predicted dehydrogenase
MGFIGVGGRGTTHLRTMLGIEGIEVTWTCDIDPSRVAAASGIVEGRTGKKPQGTGDHRRVLDAADVDAVLISTPCDVHAPLYLDTLAAGKDLYAEKPMCISVEECEQLVKAAEGSKSIFQVGFQSRYNPRIRTAVERIQAGEFGEIVEMRGAYLAHFGPLRGWQSKRARSGDWMVEQAVHFFDIMNWTFRGLASKAYGWGRKDIFNADEPDRDVTDYYSALIEYPGGVIVNWLHSWLCPAGGTFNRHTMHFMGRAGAVDLNDGGIEYMDSSRAKEMLPDPGGDATRFAQQAFLDCVRTRKVPFSNVYNGRDAVLVALLVREAVDSRRQVTMGEVRKT